MVTNSSRVKYMEKRVFILGIDGAELDLILQWVKEEKLPNFRHVLQKGIYGKMKSTMPPITPCAWPSLYTGKNPGKHGQFDFFVLDERKELRLNVSEYKTEKTLWRILSDHGKRCCIINVPFTYPPEPVNGIMISGFMTPSTTCQFTYPAEFKEEILTAFPHFRVAEEVHYSPRHADQKAYLTEIKELTRLQGDVAEYCYKKETWDLFMAVFMGADHVQHHYWKHMDSHHPNYSESPHFKDAVYSVYCELDSILGKFLDMISDDTVFFIVSDHGFGTYERDVNVNKMLKDKGYLKLKRSLTVFMKSILLFLGINPGRVITLLLKTGLIGLSKKHPEKRRGKILDRLSFNWKDVDWKRTKAYSFGYYGTIYLTAQDTTGELKEAIAQDLYQLREGETPIVDELFFKEDIYHGGKLKICPDIVFPMRNFSYAASNVFLFPSGRLFSSPKTFQSGGHRLGATFIVFSKGMNAGQVEDIEIIDVAPTVLSILGISPPRDMDGKSVDIPV
jgi:predicted AlkP superfamily phosphohydrolase/phosphomutase